MSVLEGLARSVERFVYDRICELSELTPPDWGVPAGPDTLASPLDGNESYPRRQ